MSDISRVAMISLHTSPLDQPGMGDAGGMNVYVAELARRLAGQGVEVDIFTRATSSQQAPRHPLCDGVTVEHIQAGPFEGLNKDDLPSQLCAFAREVMRAEAKRPNGHYDAIHSHYWLSGQVGTLARDRWQVPLVHTMHTMAKVKNAALATGDIAEPMSRVIGEEQVVKAADLLLANTSIEAVQLAQLYDADPARVEVVHPGVDLGVFQPVRRASARLETGLPGDALVVMFAGRLQPLKAPDVLIKAVAQLLARRPEWRSRLVVPIVGGPSGSGMEHPQTYAQLAAEEGVDDVVRFVPPVSQTELATWMSAADLVAVPSYNESFGLVAVEAQASGTPVLAARVGGLPTIVSNGHSGVLLDNHEPQEWARALEQVLGDDTLRARLARGALSRAGQFSWERAAADTISAYTRARATMESDLSAVDQESA